MIPELLQSQKDYFKTGNTKAIAFRKALLKRLKQELITREDEIISALHNDFRKPIFESVTTETATVIGELDLTISKLNKWAKPKKVTPSLLNFPSSAKIYSEPYGATLIISPWNYPYQLALIPLIAAVSAGNTVILKPSELTPHTSRIINTIVTSVFNAKHVTVVQGDVTTATTLLAQSWDYIFFTGSVAVGKIVAKAAAAHLTPTTLELGGKNPCIVTKSADIKLSAKRIVWGKFINAGQTCIAPDYIVIHKARKEQFYSALKTEIEIAYSETPEASKDLARIINDKNFNRLKALLTNEQCIIGGETNPETLYVAPTVIDEPKLDSPVMKDEIFGPILPVISYENDSEIESIINTYNKPLALYVFSTDKAQVKKIIQRYSFGGGAINDTVVHFINHKLPFGGVGNSGIGAYHGQFSFDTFSHKKGLVKKANWIDLPFRYAPYKGKLKRIRFILKWLQ